ncbi:MAG: hypothetical protein AAF533_03265 [Acidobacteriota bacterium]
MPALSKLVRMLSLGALLATSAHPSSARALPALEFSTYFGVPGNSGASARDAAHAVVASPDGGFYVAGHVSGSGLPTTPGAFQPEHHEAPDPWGDGFVARIGADDELIALTYFGGARSETIQNIALDQDGNVLIGLSAAPSTLPVRIALPDDEAGPRGGIDDIYVARLDPDLTTLLHATYLGGSDRDMLTDLMVGLDGSIYLTGVTESPDFPLRDPLQDTLSGLSDVFVARLSPDGRALLSSTYLGGTGTENYATDEALPDSPQGRLAQSQDGAIWLTGWTTSEDFPTAAPLQPAHGGRRDVYVVRVDADVSELQFSTWLGGELNDEGMDIDFGPLTGSVHVLGVTESYDLNRLNPDVNGGPGFARTTSFLASLSPDAASFEDVVRFHDTTGDGTRSTLLEEMVIDTRGAIHLVGETHRTAIPLVRPLQDAINLGLTTQASDAIVVSLSPELDSMELATYLGGGTQARDMSPGLLAKDQAHGIAIDTNGGLVVVGRTSCVDFPTVAPLQSALSAGPLTSPSDAFFARIADAATPLLRIRPGISDNLDMGWDETNGDPRFGIYRGTLESLLVRHEYDHVLVTDCDLRTGVTLPATEQDSYFLLVHVRTDGRLDFGEDSEGRARGGPAAPCP